MALTKSDVVNYRKELEAALRIVSAKTGINVSIGRIVYSLDGSSIRCKIEGVQRTAGNVPGVVTNAKDAALAANSWRLGSTFDETKTYLSMSLGRVKIVGFARQAKKYPFIISTVAGKRYKITSFEAKNIVANGAV